MFTTSRSSYARSAAYRIGSYVGTDASLPRKTVTTETGDSLEVFRSAEMHHYTEDDIDIKMSFVPPHPLHGSSYTFTVRERPDHWWAEQAARDRVRELSREHDAHIAALVGDAATSQLALFNLASVEIASAGEQA